MASKFEETFKRINEINWLQKVDLRPQKKSTRALIKEQIRRLSIWLYKLDPNYQKHLLVDVVSYLGLPLPVSLSPRPSVCHCTQNDNIILPAGIVEVIANYPNRSRHRNYFLKMSLNWALLDDAETLAGFELPHP